MIEDASYGQLPRVRNMKKECNAPGRRLYRHPAAIACATRPEWCHLRHNLSLEHRFWPSEHTRRRTQTVYIHIPCARECRSNAPPVLIGADQKHATRPRVLDMALRTRSARRRALSSTLRRADLDGEYHRSDALRPQRNPRAEVLKMLNL